MAKGIRNKTSTVEERGRKTSKSDEMEFITLAKNIVLSFEQLGRERLRGRVNKHAPPSHQRPRRHGESQRGRKGGGEREGRG